MARPARVCRCLLLAALAGCGTEPRAGDVPAPADTGPAADAPRATLPPPPPPAADRTIRADGIGHARIGMTIAELRAALPAELALGPAAPFMVDVDALPVVLGRDTLYYVLLAAGAPAADDTAIELLATEHPAFRTLEGVTPGMTLAEAAALAGAPRLAYSTNDESREWAAFPAVAASIMVRVVPSSDASPFAGYYMTDGEYNETSRYDPDARVSMIVVRKD